MGVKGLTTYVAKNAEKYLMPYELHDCDVVIDGDNLASQLFINVCYTSNCAYGGDYDMFYIYVTRFFELLKKCNVMPYVLLDGGYQHGKLRTVYKRLTAKISAIKHIDPRKPRKTHFPLMMREVFVDVLKDNKIKFMRCLFEADEEIAVLAKRLNCPVLSYDSDFYIFNVLYIPFITLTLKVYKKIVYSNGNVAVKVERQSLKTKKKNKQNRKAVLDVDGNVDETEEQSNGSHCYYYLDCCLYKIENLLKTSRLKSELVPLFAAMLGNDYIERSVLKEFYSTIYLKKSKKKETIYQRQISALVKWLQNETLESAISKIEHKVKANKREAMMKKVLAASHGYNIEYSECCEFFGLPLTPLNTENDRVSKIDEIIMENDLEENEGDQSNNEEEDNVDSSDASDISEAESHVNHEEEADVDDAESPEIEPEIPDWIKQRYMRGEFPRYFMDLIYLKKFFNATQIENFLMPDANLISIEIIIYIHALLNAPEKPDLLYLTRVVRISQIQNKIYKCCDINDKGCGQFDPTVMKNLKFFKAIFENIENKKDIFEMAPYIHGNSKLYFLALIYWAKRSEITNFCYIRSIIICMLTLTVIDKKCGPNRTTEEFTKSYGKTLSKIKSEVIKRAHPKLNEIQESPSIDKILISNSTVTIDTKLEFSAKNAKLLMNKITKYECVIIQERLIPFLSLDNSVYLKKQHSEYSSTILHGLAEFQSVVFHMSSLNALLNYPFPEIKLGQLYKGFFLFNMYISLKKRNNPDHYVKNNLFKNAINLWNCYEYLMGWCKKLLPDLEDVIKEHKTTTK